MNWRIFFLILINLFCIVFPYNIIGCGETPDPYDEYTTFFRNDLSHKGYHSFYYINDNFLYDPEEKNTKSDEFSAEWAAYCHHTVSVRQAYQFICTFKKEDIAVVDEYLHRKPPVPITPIIRRNAMTGYFLRSRDTVALRYILFAKEAEVFNITGGGDTLIYSRWVIPTKDSSAMNRLIEQAQKGYTTTTNPFIRARYAYQAVSLAFYNHRNADCIRFFDNQLKYDPSIKALYAAGLAFKAGALMRVGKRFEAAYGYSRSFSLSTVSRVHNYVCFGWCVHRQDASDRQQCLALCRNDRERADMLGLFLLGSNASEAASLKKIYQLSPGSPVLEVLAIREVNKIEQNFFTPALHLQKGGLRLYYMDQPDDDQRPDVGKWLREADELSGFYHTLSMDSAVSDKALFETAAAYLSYITRRYVQADSWLDRAATLPASDKLKDQQAMTRLLVTISKSPVIDSSFETRLLPSIQWLRGKALSEGLGMKENYYDSWTNGLWQQFYRNLMTEVLAKRYHQQGDVCKETLCIGNGEKMSDIYARKAYDYEPRQTLNFVHNKVSGADLLSLDVLLRSPQKSPWEEFLCSHFNVSKDEITSTIAAAHLRDYHFREADKWLRKIKDPNQLELKRNPFGDILSDYQGRMFSIDRGVYNKISFVRAMISLLDKEGAKKATANDLYKLATGFYNMTYYGRAWETVKFDRPSDEWNVIPKGASFFEKEYYGCYTAEKYYQKAMDASKDRNFKARCLFMMARCSQKQIKLPSYKANDYARWQKFFADCDYRVRHNKYFPQLYGEYTNTSFYKEAFSSCSYLRDFVQKN